MSMASQKNTEVTIKTLKMQVDQLAKQLVEILSPTFNSNTHTNLKENYNVVKNNLNVVIKVMEEEAEEGRKKEESQEKKCEIIQQTLPQKKLDHGVVILPITICKMEVGNASGVKRVGGLEIGPNASTLQKEDKACRKPVEKIKDVLIILKSFNFLYI